MSTPIPLEVASVAVNAIPISNTRPPAESLRCDEGATNISSQTSDAEKELLRQKLEHRKFELEKQIRKLRAEADSEQSQDTLLRLSPAGNHISPVGNHNSISSSSLVATNNTCLLWGMPKSLTKIMGSFLDAQELYQLSRSAHYFSSLWGEELAEKRQISDLLSYVFNADPKKVKESLANYLMKPGGRCIILTRSYCKEGHYSESLKKNVWNRTWRNVSPLEAAALCGDNYLVQELLTYVPNETCYEYEALQQLNGVFYRTETSENGGYLAPLKALVTAYQTYDEYCIQANPSSQISRNSWKRTDELWGQVGEMQKRLPVYALQEFLTRSFIHYPLEGPPRRKLCVHITPLDPATFGETQTKCDSAICLNQGLCATRITGGRGPSAERDAKEDAEIFPDLIKFCETGLDCIIKSLKESIRMAGINLETETSVSSASMPKPHSP